MKCCRSLLVDKAKYLERISCRDVTGITDAVLINLHRQHLYQIPFENLDVYYSRMFDLEIGRVYQKVVHERRGGFCYELNLLFNWLLREIGFDSRIIAARIVDEQGTLGPAFDHMCVYVKTENAFLVDVGYGDLFITPLEIKSGVQYDGRNYFCIDKTDGQDYLLSMSADGVDFQRRYTFSLDSVKEEDFHASCLDKQKNPNSYFVKNVVCTKPTDTGRVTIFNDKLIERKGDSKTETPIAGDDDLRLYLMDKFGITIDSRGSYAKEKLV
jgi:N-hydroxyarylamine O-acetyltransferase